MDYRKKQQFLNIAKSMSAMSRCVKEPNAAVIVKNDMLIGGGINGTLPGIMNCDDYYNNDGVIKNYLMSHDTFNEKYECEAEMNAILLCSRNGISCQDAVMLTYQLPKPSIIKYIAIAGINELYYVVSNDNEMAVRELCLMFRIDIDKIEL